MKAEDMIVFYRKETKIDVDETQFKVPCKINLQVWDANLIGSHTFLGKKLKVICSIILSVSSIRIHFQKLGGFLEYVRYLTATLVIQNQKASMTSSSFRRRELPSISHSSWGQKCESLWSASNKDRWICAYAVHLQE